jgi:hypothetical protein
VLEDVGDWTLKELGPAGAARFCRINSTSKCLAMPAIKQLFIGTLGFNMKVKGHTQRRCSAIQKLAVADDVMSWKD